MLVYGHSISLISIKQIPLLRKAGEFVLNLLSSSLFLPSDESDNFFSACLYYILKLVRNDCT